MKQRNYIVIGLLVLIGYGIYTQWGIEGVGWYGVLLGIFEVISRATIRYLREQSPLFITEQDEQPVLSPEGLQKFFTHGYDPELGWVRKPNTSKQERGKSGTTKFHINEYGARRNPGHENLPGKISCYGDSFTFSRQVNDNETWEWYLSELTQSNVRNFGVGNYGIDQALLRLKREFPKHKSKIVIMGVVPSTIVRILAIWKHYHEYGNTFGFKPRYIVKSGTLTLLPNPIDSEEKFTHYQKYLPSIRKRDFFYKYRFKKELFEFPYFVSIVSNPLRNIPLIGVFLLRRTAHKQQTSPTEKQPSPLMNFLMKAKLHLFTPAKVELFSQRDKVELLEKIVEEFERYVTNQNAKPILLWMPQKDDILFMKRRGIYYKEFIARIQKKVQVIDLTEPLMQAEDLDAIFTDENTDGGHFSPTGNKFVAEIINTEINTNSSPET